MGHGKGFESLMQNKGIYLLNLIWELEQKDAQRQHSIVDPSKEKVLQKEHGNITSRPFWQADGPIDQHKGPWKGGLVRYSTHQTLWDNNRITYIYVDISFTQSIQQKPLNK